MGPKAVPEVRAAEMHRDPEPPGLSVVIPSLDEALHLPDLLADLAPLRTRGHEVIVVDGGSTDATRELAAVGADRVLSVSRGRARQMNAGAAAARGEAFWFLHADCRITPAVFDAVLHALGQGCSWGRCNVRLSSRGPLLSLTARMMNLRSCITGIATGDQGIFISRSAFEAVEGFPGIPLMEDVEISRRLKRRVGRPVCVRAALVTSSRRWERRGVLRTILLMWGLRLAYWLGTDPARLARWYR